MSDEHKASLTQGRREGQIVRDYLEALLTHGPARGARAGVESVDRRLAALDAALASAAPAQSSKLRRERRALITERDRLTEPVDIDGLEQAFVAIAASYGRRQGLSYLSWREVGVSAGVLSRAGISPSR